MAHKYDPPWRVGPFQDIVEVGWASSLGVLILSWVQNGETDFTFDPMLEGLYRKVDGVKQPVGVIDLLTAHIEIKNPGAPSVEIKETVSGAMRQNLYAWNYPPWIKEEVHTDEQTYHFVDLGLYHIEWAGAVVMDYFEDALGSIWGAVLC